VRRVVVHGPGGWDELRVETHPDVSARPGEVLVDVQACGVNYADCIVRMGLYASAKEYVGWPITPGFEFAGRVKALGEGVDDLAVGDEVLGVTRFGGYASELSVPREQIFRRPSTLTAEQAATFPAVHMTAWYALFELAHPRPGSTILVHSAAGGVGTALVQLGRIAGARVVGVVGRSHKVAIAQELGAEVVVDKSRQGLWSEPTRAAPEGDDVVLDANGVETLRQSYAHLAPGGKLVVYGFHSMLRRGKDRPSWPKLAIDWLRTPRFDPLDLTNDNKSVLAFNLSYLFDRTDMLAEAMGQLLGWLEAGRLRPPPVETFPFAKVADAHRAIESGETVGKLALTL